MCVCVYILVLYTFYSERMCVYVTVHCIARACAVLYGHGSVQALQEKSRVMCWQLELRGEPPALLPGYVCSASLNDCRALCPAGKEESGRLAAAANISHLRLITL